MKVLVTCPPMLGMIDDFIPYASRKGLELVPAEVTQTLSETELERLVPNVDGWIIGDDPATRRVFEAGKAGRLKAAVKWGVGIDNVDFDACRELSIPITNTPNMFGAEVADIAVGYVIALARQTFDIDRGVRAGNWPKPRGISLSGKTVALIGFGDIGRNVAKRLLAADMKIIAYDPETARIDTFAEVTFEEWPNKIEKADFIVITCALTETSRHMLNANTFENVKPGVRVVNVSRGAVIDELALINSLKTEKVYGAALDVFETEPLPMGSPLRNHPQCIFGSHNSSNTLEAVRRTSKSAIEKLAGFLGT